MNKKAWNGIESLFLVAIALVITFVFGLYAMNGLNANNSQNSSFYNSTNQGVTEYSHVIPLSGIIVWVFGIALVVWVISILRNNVPGGEIG